MQPCQQWSLHYIVHTRTSPQFSLTKREKSMYFDLPNISMILEQKKDKDIVGAWTYTYYYLTWIKIT